jgi:AcrR family transcriptional regulator
MAVSDTASQSPRERILRTASELFYAEGIRAVGVDTIIARAGVAKASFYKHFPSKDDLVVAFLGRRDALLRHWLEQAVEHLSPDPAGRPLAVFDALAQRFASKEYRGCAFINCMVETADRAHAVHHAADDHKREMTQYLGRLLKAAGVPTANELAGEFMLLMDGAIVTALREGSPRAAQSAKRIAATLLRDALKADPAAGSAVTRRRQ